MSPTPLRSSRRARPSGGRRGRSYCLVCYAPLGIVEGASAECRRCGATNVRADQLEYWTREPALVRLEAVVKVAIAIATTAAVLLMLPAVMGTRGGWMMILPAALGAALWTSASRITRKPSGARAGFLWMNAGVIGLPTALALWWNLREPGFLALAIACALLVPTGLFATLLFERWRKHRVASRYRAALAEGVRPPRSRRVAVEPST